MDKYKTISAFYKWFSPIKLANCSKQSKKKIQEYNAYRKKLSFESVIMLFLYAINEEKESLRDLTASLLHTDLQKETGVTSISHSQLARALQALDSSVLEELFHLLLQSIQKKTRPTKRNSLYLIDSSTFPLNRKKYPWARFRKTKSGVKFHLKLSLIDKDTFYPEEFLLTSAKEQDSDFFDPFINQAEATYIFDRGYLDLERLDRLHREGYFFVTRLKKYTKIFLNQTLVFQNTTGVLRDELVQLGSKTTLTSLFRLVTFKDEQGRVFQFITNRMDVAAEEVADMYKARWQIELFFKHIKQHMTIKTFFSQSEKGVYNQFLLTMIAFLLTVIVKLETRTTCSLFQIKRLFRYLLFRPFEQWVEQLIPT